MAEEKQRIVVEAWRPIEAQLPHCLFDFLLGEFSLQALVIYIIYLTFGTHPNPSRVCLTEMSLECAKK